MTGITDDEVHFLELLKARSRDAFDALYDKYAGPLYSVICRKVQDTHIAEMILQDVYVKVWKEIRCFDPAKCRFFIWMYHISLDLCDEYLNGIVYHYHVQTKG